jgi:hypothetical protein
MSSEQKTPQVIMIHLRKFPSSGGADVPIKAKVTCSFSRIAAAYCARKNVSLESINFKLNGQIQPFGAPQGTLDSWGISNDQVIHVYHEAN